jgi:hypothetical protein
MLLVRDTEDPLHLVDRDGLGLRNHLCGGGRGVVRILGVEVRVGKIERERLLRVMHVSEAHAEVVDRLVHAIDDLSVLFALGIQGLCGSLAR